jgi:hypothetical protein
VKTRLTALAAAALAVAVWSCTKLPSDPDTPFSIAFRRAPSPSVVLGDVMRDSTGQPAKLRAFAFNVRGDTIRDFAVTYFLVARDSQPAKLEDGLITAYSDTAYIGDTLRVVAVAGGVQSTPLRIVVTLKPDALVLAGSDTVRFLLPATDSLPLSGSMSVRLRHAPMATEPVQDTVVPAYEVRYRVVGASSGVSDSSYVTIADGSRRFSPIDTTDASGIATRQLRVRRAKYPYPYDTITPGHSAVDTIYVDATASYMGSAVAGSPVRFRVLVTLAKPPTS